MQEYLIEKLCCPQCFGELEWEVKERLGEHIETGSASCPECGISFPVQEGIGIFLTDELEREDLWEEVDSTLNQHLKENPDVEKRLMDVPLESLGPADLQFRAGVLDERGNFAEAEKAESLAHEGLYTPEHLNCWQAMVESVLARVEDSKTPILDIASGRGYLVSKLIENTAAPVIASDFSPRVLRRNRRWLAFKGWYERASLLAFDARKIPFKARSVEIVTTNLGLPNIQGTGEFLNEVRRILSGEFLAITAFYPPNDGNSEIIAQFGLRDALYKDRLQALMTECSLEVRFEDACVGKAAPTPRGEVLEDLAVDGLPVVETELEWSLVMVN